MHQGQGNSGWTTRGGGGSRRPAGALRARVAAGAAAVAAIACMLPAGASASAIPVGVVGYGTTDSAHGLGLLPTVAPRPSAGALARVAAAAASLPASVDLTPNAMPVGDQGSVGSCAAWSSDYAALGYWENKLGVSGGGLEPMYSYSQVTGGVDQGSTIEGNLQIAVTQGIDNQADYYQGNFDYRDMPTSAERAHAVNWKLSGYSDLTINPSASSTTTQTSIETALAGGDPVVIGIPVYNNFFYVGSANNGYYGGISGSLAGYHAIAALGYNSQGLVIENSWGTGWGNAGYATLSWSFVNQYVFDAVQVGPLVVGQPVDAVAPSISGTPRRGQTLTASPGTWSPGGTTVSYQWQRAASGSSSWTVITGATAASYVPGAADVGNTLRVVVTETNSNGQGSAASNATGAIASGGPVVATVPTAGGTLRVGQTLSASAGTWSPAATAYAYQWQRSTNAGSTWIGISGATHSTYVTTVTDANAYERVVVTATNSFGSGSSTSAAIGPISDVPYNTTLPGITGNAYQGQRLTATAGGWSPAGTSYAYQWQRSTDAGQTWASVSGATQSSYVLGSSDVGANVRVLITATNAYGTADAWRAVAATIGNGAPATTGAPVLGGTAIRGYTLTVTNGSWNPAPSSFSYQWQSLVNGTWTNITGATSAHYVPAVSDEGTTLRALVTGTNAYGQATATSGATTSIRASAPAKLSMPTISGTVRAGYRLTAAPGSWSGMGNTITYQWQRLVSGTWTNVTGATSSTYLLVHGVDSGTQLRVVVTVTNADGSVSVPSGATASVAG
jgi:Papain family cysteine protease/Ig domain of plant-specific actin-binding protein